MWSQIDTHNRLATSFPQLCRRLVLEIPITRPPEAIWFRLKKGEEIIYDVTIRGLAPKQV